jgi:hypothetical protein
MEKFQDYRVSEKGVTPPEKRYYKELTLEEKRVYNREAYKKWYATGKEELCRKKKEKRWAARCKKMESEGFPIPIST